MIEKYILIKLLNKYNAHMRRRLAMIKQKNQLEQPLDAFNDAFYTWIEETENLTDRKFH